MIPLLIAAMLMAPADQATSITLKTAPLVKADPQKDAKKSLFVADDLQMWACPDNYKMYWREQPADKDKDKDSLDFQVWRPVPMGAVVKKADHDVIPACLQEVKQ